MSDHEIKPSTFNNLVYLVKGHKDGVTLTHHESTKLGPYYKLSGEGFLVAGDTICECINEAYKKLTEPDEITVNGVKYIKK